jgi:hypothetical protein
MLRASGRRVDLSCPFVDATLTDGSRLHVVIPDITRRHWAVNIRRFVLRAHSLAELVRLGTMTGQCARFLEAAVVAGLNIVTAGATQAGKTTLLNCLAAAIPPRERVITCEEVFELQVGLPDTVAMQTRQPNLEDTKASLGREPRGSCRTSCTACCLSWPPTPSGWAISRHVWTRSNAENSWGRRRLAGRTCWTPMSSRCCGMTWRKPPAAAPMPTPIGPRAAR